ncbi:hypothetical protein FP993_19495 [Salmonella enterica]|nr:hypothetical protein [Salmonella enterica]ECJ3243662.1 hypothetical protein [Salmonella enterica]
MKNYKFNQIELIAAITKEIERQRPGTPADDRMNTIIKAVNMICDEYSREKVTASQGMGLTAWLASDDTGLSSLFMASVLSGQFASTNNYPRDPDDLGRCIRLIEAVPELAEKISLMAQHGHQWSAVAQNWERWSHLYREGDGNALYLEMRAAFEQGGAA